MDLPQSDQYLPVGCLTLDKEISKLEPELWNLPSLRRWSSFVSDTNQPDTRHIEAVKMAHYLPLEVQTTLSQCSPLRHVISLLRARWAMLEFQICKEDENLAIIRVSLLPDDVCRSVLDRSNSNLRKARLVVLHELDYSETTWMGNCVPSRRSYSQMIAANRNPVNEAVTLLELFNRIPSPNPEPMIVQDSHAQDTVYGLLESSIPGLTTSLFPYQRRSAALMLQKESQPATELDPRLIPMINPMGAFWYFDPVTTDLLGGARYYDGVCGGILAEEMGSGKTLICLALIMATKDLPTKPPELYRGGQTPRRSRIASLADMAASCANRNAVPWKIYLDNWSTQFKCDFSTIARILQRNPPSYLHSLPTIRRASRRRATEDIELTKIMFLSPASFIVVPNNLMAQWNQEIAKHTIGLDILVLNKRDPLPDVECLTFRDIVLISQSHFEKIEKEQGVNNSPLASIHFKRCIVDEGHKLGNSRIGHKSNLLLGLNSMTFSSRWIVTGTPSHGLYGVGDARKYDTNRTEMEPFGGAIDASYHSSVENERKDLQRLGSISSLYLKTRPWANSNSEPGDTLADWDTYFLLPKHSPRSHGRWECLRATINSLIVRHQLAEVSELLPPVVEKTVVLKGSYQDQMSLNIFSMMIICNAVQSQRTDMDYFFHSTQKKSLLQIVHNLKQTSFFGGSFFSSEEISKAVETAEDFLRERKVPIDDKDETLLLEAIRVGHLAVDNKLRALSNQLHEIPLRVQNLPLGTGLSWSLDGRDADDICTSASMMLYLQKTLRTASAEKEKLNALLNGGLMQEGLMERDRVFARQRAKEHKNVSTKNPGCLAGNTKLGDDSPRKARLRHQDVVHAKDHINAEALPPALLLPRITSTASAKLSYLVDAITEYHEHEKIIVFYENENTAWYLASMLDVVCLATTILWKWATNSLQLQIQHLIYARGLTVERRALYINTFHHNPAFRVLLMDLSQAAFGLDMREASRIYFINPVLNPQVQAQAVGRVRRISQKKPVAVETLVLKDSIDEVILERKQHMTQAEHREAKSILDVRPIYNWIKNVSIIPLPDVDGGHASQMAPLHRPQRIFGDDFGKTSLPDEGLVHEYEDFRRKRTMSEDSLAQPSRPTKPRRVQFE